MASKTSVNYLTAKHISGIGETFGEKFSNFTLVSAHVGCSRFETIALNQEFEH
jgi:hypothetical protein